MEASRPEYQETLGLIEQARPEYLAYRQRVARTGGRDTQLNALYEPIYRYMDHLLEDLFAQKVMHEAFSDERAVI